MKKRINAKVVKASHIVPYALGEVNVTYLFGLEPQKGYEAIWDIKNGLPLHVSVEKALNAAQLVIVEDDTSHDLKLVVLDENLLDGYVNEAGTKNFRDVHNQRLEFITDARPGRPHLYLHYLLALFRRKRYNVKGWEKDTSKATSGYIWGSPGPWLRRSIMQALAFEIGDVEKLNTEGLADFPDKISDEREKGMAVQIRQALVESEEERREQETGYQFW